MNIQEVERRKLSSTALVVVILLAAGSLVPVFRDALVAARLGATNDSDAYFLSTYIVLMVVTILIAESMVPATVVTLSIPEDEQPSHGWSLARTLLFAGLGLALISIVVILAAEPITTIFAPGFDATTANIAARALVVVAPAIALFGIARLVGAFLNSAGYFLLPAMLTPIVAFGAIIPLLAGTSSPVVAAAGWTIGAATALVLFLALAIFVVLTNRARHPVRIRLTGGQIRQLLRLAMPLLFLVTIRQGTEIVDRVISSGIGSGAMTSIVLAKKTMILPHTILIAAVGAVALPYLSRQQSGKERADAFADTINLALFFLLPATLILAAGRTEFVTILYGHGEFSGDDVATTARLLGIYALGLAPVTIAVILQNSFATLGESMTPLLPYFVTLAGFILLAWSGSRIFGLPALPTAFVVAETGYAITLGVLLNRKAPLNVQRLAWPAGIAIAAALVALLVTIALNLISIDNVWLRLALMTALVVFTYAGVVLGLRHPIAVDYWRTIRRRETEIAAERTYQRGH